MEGEDKNMFVSVLMPAILAFFGFCAQTKAFIDLFLRQNSAEKESAFHLEVKANEQKFFGEKSGSIECDMWGRPTAHCPQRRSLAKRAEHTNLMNDRQHIVRLLLYRHLIIPYK